MVGYRQLVRTARLIIIIQKLAKPNQHPRTTHISHLHSTLVILSTRNVALQPMPPTLFLLVLVYITSPAHCMRQLSHARITQIWQLIPLATHNPAPLMTQNTVLLSGAGSMVRLFFVRATASATPLTHPNPTPLHLTVD